MHDRDRTKEELIAELDALRRRVAELEAGVLPASFEETLGTVSTPEPLEPIFLKAQSYVARYFREKVEDPRHATITISGERYILVRAASMSVEFFDMVTSLYTGSGPEEARAVANNLLFDLAHSIGKADAKAFHTRMGVTDPIDRLSAGPVHFSFAGWAFVKILPESAPSPDDDYFLLYDHPFSFESNAWVSRGRRSDFPVCIMNSGYSSGWCEESFGMPLVAAEIQCVAKGDPQCRFIMAPPSRIEEHLSRRFGGTYARASGTEVAVPEYFQRKRLEEALLASHAELERRVAERTEELARANEALHAEMAERRREEEERQLLERQIQHAQKLESLGILAGGIAHDFNNLLVGILGNAGLALMRLESDDPLRRTIEGIQAAGTRAADLTKQMLAYSGRGKFVIQFVDLTAVVEEMAELLGASISKRATCRFDLASDVPVIEADATQIHQVVMNLITNASEALGEGAGDITLRTGSVRADRAFFASAHLDDDLPEGRYAFVEVSDTGCGMDEETRAKIFDPFFTTKFMGRGLGLAAVLGIVRGHQGTIRVTSAQGEGTTVLVLFPASNIDAPTPSGQHAALAPELPGWRGSGTVLVVDDEAVVRDMTSDLLAELGFDVVVARDGREGVDVFRERAGDLVLVLLDLTMPRMSGEEALAEMRRIRPDAKVIVMSGYSRREVLAQFAEESLAGFIQKPFNASDFGEALRRAIEE